MIKVTCNKCGEPPTYDNFVSVSYVFGYGTIRDGTRIDFELCEKCLTQFINSFKLNVE